MANIYNYLKPNGEVIKLFDDYTTLASEGKHRVMKGERIKTVS